MLHMLGPKLKFSSAFQPLTDCQTEVVHKSALSSFASHVHVESYHDLHKEVMDEIAQHNANYEMRIDVRKLFKTFNVGDVILLACSTDPLQILKKPNYQVCVIDFDISSIFNIEDLVDYKSFNFNPSNFLIDESSHEPIFRLSIPPILNILPNAMDQIDKILDDEIIMICKFLVQ